MRFRHLLPLILLAWLHLFLRVQQIRALPAFIDEDNHLRRAAALHHLDSHPAQNSQGKFLLYTLLALPDLNERGTALFAGRYMVALASLLSGALILAILRRWLPWEGALLGMALYALLPYSLFYERMALADPWAGVWGVVTLYASLQLAARRSYVAAGLAGGAAALAVMAKLTMGLAVLFPVLALLILAPRENPLLAFSKYWAKTPSPSPFPEYREGEKHGGRWQADFLLLVVAGGAFVLLWLPTLIPAYFSLQNDTNADDYILVNAEWLDDSTTAESLGQKLAETWIKYRLLASTPLAILSLGLLAWGLYARPRPVVFLALCLLCAWLPSILLTRTLQSRYLMSGIPILVMLLAVAWPGERVGWGWAWALLILWGGVFAGPFAHRLMTDPASAPMPALDERNYFWDRYNAYGLREALAWIGDQEEGEVYVLALVKTCRMADLYPQPGLLVECPPGHEGQTLAEAEWAERGGELLAAGERVYILTSEQVDVPPPDGGWQWRASFAKPELRQAVYVWRLGE
jgi:hypothetical protein